MKRSDTEQYGRVIAGVIRDYVARELQPIVERLNASEERCRKLQSELDRLGQQQQATAKHASALDRKFGESLKQRGDGSV